MSDELVPKKNKVYKSKRGKNFIRVENRGVRWLCKTTFKAVVMVRPVKKVNKEIHGLYKVVPRSVIEVIDEDKFYKRFKDA